MSTMKKELIISEIFFAARNWLRENNYTEITVPRIVRASGSCENVNTLYTVCANGQSNWYGRSAYLAQTGQLYLESLVPKLGRVFCDGPSFRAEEDVDARHLTEFRMIEIELPTDFKGLLDQMQGFINAIVSHIVYLNEVAELGLSEERIAMLKKCPRVFTEITYDQAIVLLQGQGFKLNWGDDLKHKHELALVEMHGGQPLFITRFPDPMIEREEPIEVEKFFNMIPDPKNQGRVLSCDCILPFSGEAIGAAARIYQADILIERLKNSRMFKRLEKLGGDLDDFSWYIEALQKGGVPHAGCGFGMARIIQFILGEDDIGNCVNFISNKNNLI